MKIVDMQTQALSIPIERPYGGSSRYGTVDRMGPVLVRLRTDQGLEGFGYSFAFAGHKMGAYKSALDELKEEVIGEDPLHSARLWQKLWRECSDLGRAGVFLHAMAAIDIAVWDIKGKAAGQPLYQLLGGYRDQVPAYASHLLWRSYTIDELQQDGAELVKQGFKGMKMRAGDQPSEEEVERVRALREAIGPEVDLMVDVNWRWTIYDSIRMGRRFEEYKLYWLEDPLASDDPEETAQVAAALDTPVCAGETYASKYAFRRPFEIRAMDIAMIDVLWVGGITEWMRVAAMAQAYNIPVASHLYPEISMHLVAAVPNGLYVEYMPWLDPLYREPPQFKDGYLLLPQKQGLGLELDERAIKKYQYK